MDKKDLADSLFKEAVHEGSASTNYMFLAGEARECGAPATALILDRMARDERGHAVALRRRANKLAETYLRETL